MKVLIVIQLTQLTWSIFQLITLAGCHIPHSLLFRVIAHVSVGQVAEAYNNRLPLKTKRIGLVYFI